MADETTTTTEDEELEFTDSSDIIDEVDELITTFRDSFTTHMTNALKYIEGYDKYNLIYLYDSDVLKEKMKELVIEAVPNDI